MDSFKEEEIKELQEKRRLPCSFTEEEIKELQEKGKLPYSPRPSGIPNPDAKGDPKGLHGSDEDLFPDDESFFSLGY